MPRAYQFAIFDHALCQRASPMWAFAVQGPNHSVEVGDTQCPWASTEFPRLARAWKLALRADLHQSTHD
jgi:hypothetical protein